jgi:hypothetical protein
MHLKSLLQMISCQSNFINGASYILKNVNKLKMHAALMQYFIVLSLNRFIDHMI